MKKLKLRLSMTKFINQFKDFLDNFEDLNGDDTELILSVCNAVEMKFRNEKKGGIIKKEAVVEILKSRMNIDFINKTIEFLIEQNLIIEKTILRRCEYFLKKRLLKKNIVIY